MKKDMKKKRKKGKAVQRLAESARVQEAKALWQKPGEETEAGPETAAADEAEGNAAEQTAVSAEEPAAADPADRPEVQNSEVPQSEPVVQPTEAPQPTQADPPPLQETEVLPTASGDAAPEEPLLPPEAVTGERE